MGDRDRKFFSIYQKGYRYSFPILLSRIVSKAVINLSIICVLGFLYRLVRRSLFEKGVEFLQIRPSNLLINSGRVFFLFGIHNFFVFLCIFVFKLTFHFQRWLDYICNSSVKGSIARFEHCDD